MAEDIFYMHFKLPSTLYLTFDWLMYLLYTFAAWSHCFWRQIGQRNSGTSGSTYNILNQGAFSKSICISMDTFCNIVMLREESTKKILYYQCSLALQKHSKFQCMLFCNSHPESHKIWSSNWYIVLKDFYSGTWIIYRELLVPITNLRNFWILD